jgi:radical SAM protein with 4Fe4S-binding SPASM domain
MNWSRLLPGLKKPAAPPSGPQLFHYDRKAAHERARIHLRIDADGSGLLIVNANRVMHLNPTAAAMAHMCLDELPADEAARRITRIYRISAAEALRDYTQISAQIAQLIRPDGACPIHDLGLEVAAPFSARPSAPYRMDLALTYRCNNDCAHCYNARPRLYPELTTIQWMAILDRLWRAGIPHVVFTGGEPTLRDDLPQLIAHAQRNGQIAGLNTNGRRLSDPRYLNRLVEAGLDHVQITFESHEAHVHDQMVRNNGAWKQTVAGIRNALDTRLYVMTNTTMLSDNAGSLEDTLEYLAALGVPTVGLNALIYSGKGAQCGAGLEEKDLPPLLDVARRQTDAHAQRLIWYTPTQYCNFDPVMMDLGVKGCTAALYNMCIEPDGAVIPCQSYYQPIGNLLSDNWDSIWNHSLAVDLRERRSLPEKCTGCLLLAECGGGCPLYRQATHGAKPQ